MHYDLLIFFTLGPCETASLTISTPHTLPTQTTQHQGDDSHKKKIEQRAARFGIVKLASSEPPEVLSGKKRPPEEEESSESHFSE